MHTTHGIAFQETSVDTKMISAEEQISPSGNRSQKVIGCALPPVHVNPKRTPKDFERESVDNTEIDEENFTNVLNLWKLSRRIHEGSTQFIPRFVGFVILVFKKQDSKTVLTFLPPITRPITECGTVSETIRRSIRLPEFSNMEHVHITVDVGAAEKYY